MKIASEVSATKLRGGFYSPAQLVRTCLDRVQALLGDRDRLRVLEPSAGDGAFIAGLAQHPLAEHVSWLTAVELMPAEAARCRERISDGAFAGEVYAGSALEWAATPSEPYDVAVGNPPFVRFQFVGEQERLGSLQLARRLGIELGGVSNLWLPVFLAALGALRPGGVFAFIVPAESFTGVSGHEVREWLLANVRQLNVDLFAPGSFPDVLQEVVVLSGRMTEPGVLGSRELRIREHAGSGAREWTHSVSDGSRTWTRYLLSPTQLASLDEAANLPHVSPLAGVARFEVATVTGANGYFCVDDETLDRYRLAAWARPLLPRTRHATGLAYTPADHTEVRARGLPAHLLDFSATGADPMRTRDACSYLEIGEKLALPSRYKCRIRQPWYRVPVVAPGSMLMAKRSHRYPRVIVNDARVLTTDTIYRGRLLPGTQLSVRAFTAAFHNSLTLLTAEIEGRSFGGGVLELVPSETLRLAVPRPEGIAEDFDRLDWVCRSGGESSEALIEETDALVAKRTAGLSKRLLTELNDARQTLLNLRLTRG